MGWKAATLFICDDDPAYLATRPKIDHEKAKALLHLVAGSNGTFVSTTCFSDSIWPDGDAWSIGAYAKGCVISNRHWDPIHQPPPKLIAEFPRAYILAICLQSTTDYAAFSYSEDGKLLRRFTSAQMNGLEVDETGERLPEEQDFWKQYFPTREGWCERKDNGETKKLDDAYGESLVFKITKKFLGAELDQFNEDDGFHAADEEEECGDILAVDVFRMPPKPWWKFMWA